MIHPLSLNLHKGSPMNLCFRFLFFILVLSSLLWAQAGKCGLVQIQNQIETLRSQSQTQWALQTIPSLTNCNPAEYPDSVYERITSNFHIFYTRTGPHKVLGQSPAEQERFIDSAALFLERAWSFHKDSAKMQTPLPIAVTHNFNKTPAPNKFAVEFLDLSQMHNGDTWLGGSGDAYYGLVIPEGSPWFASGSGRSTLLIENDFLYPGRRTDLKGDSVTLSNGKVCRYSISRDTIFAQILEDRINYHRDWNAGLKVTAAHELYHTFQLGYQDFRSDFHFWFEASATSSEELVAPDVNDYMQYISYIFANPQKSLYDTRADFSIRQYAAGIFHQYLARRVRIDVDHFIWNQLSGSYTGILSAMAEGISQTRSNLDSLWHDFAINLFFTGDNQQYVNAPRFATDQPQWPELHVEGTSTIQNNLLQTQNIQSMGFRVLALNSSLKDSLYFNRAELPSSVWVSLIEIPASNNQSIEITAVDNNPIILQKVHSASTLYLVVSYGVGSQMGQAVESVDFEYSFGHNLDVSDVPVLKNGAFPNPFRPNRQSLEVCFIQTELEPGDFVEIFSQSGDKIFRVSFDESNPGTLCWNAKNQSGSYVQPGLYFYRFSSESKLRKLIILR
jgi:hypothetical protein